MEEFPEFTAGLTHALEGRHEDALACFDRVLSKSRAHLPALGGRAAALAHLRRTALAAAAFRELISHEPHDAEHHRQLALCLMEESGPDAARASVDEALRLRPEASYRRTTAVEIYNYAGHLMMLCARHRDAGDTLDALQLLGMAERVFRFALEVEPELDVAREGLAVIQSARHG